MATSENSKDAGTVQSITALLKPKTDNVKQEKTYQSRTALPKAQTRNSFCILAVDVIHIVEPSLRDVLRPLLAKAAQKPKAPNWRGIAAEVITAGSALIGIISAKSIFGPDLTLGLSVLFALIVGWFVSSAIRDILEYQRLKQEWQHAQNRDKDPLDVCLDKIKALSDQT